MTEQTRAERDKARQAMTTDELVVHIEKFEAEVDGLDIKAVKELGSAWALLGLKRLQGEVKMSEDEATLQGIPEEFASVLSYMAYERGHSAGEEEVSIILKELVSDLKPAIEKYTKRIKDAMRVQAVNNARKALDEASDALEVAQGKWREMAQDTEQPNRGEKWNLDRAIAKKKILGEVLDTAVQEMTKEGR